MTIRPLLLALVLAPTLASAQEPLPPPPPPEAAPEELAPLPPPPAPPAASAEAAPAAAAEAPLPPPPPPPPPVAPWPRFGLALGAGFPQAASLDALYRPAPWVRLSAGPSWDYVGFGLHGGVTFTPFRWAVTPTVGFEGGHFFELDVNKFAKSTSAEVKPLLRRVQLEYLAAMLGVEFGSQRGFTFALRAGLAYLRVDSHGTGTFTGSGGVGGNQDAVITVTNPNFRGTAPTVQLAFQYFL